MANKGKNISYCKKLGLRSFKGILLSLSFAWLILSGLLSVPVHAVNPGNINLKVRVDITPPDAISDLVVQKGTGTEGSVVLNWTEPGNDGMVGQPNIYHVRFSTTANINDVSAFGNAVLFNSGWSPGTGGSARVEVIENLTPGQTYYWAIRAQDPVGLMGTWSRTGGANAVNFAPSWDEPPAQVQNVTGISGDVQVSLSWTGLTLAQKTTDFDHYKIYRSTYPDFSLINLTTTTPFTAYIDTQVVNGSTYYYRVVGVDKGINSIPPYYGNALESLAWSTATVVPLPPRPFAPSNLQAVNATPTSINWQWQDNASNEDGFRVYTTTGGILAQLALNTTYFIQQTLTPNASYSITVKSFNMVGESTGSVTGSKYTTTYVPFNLMRSTATASTITMEWNANNNPEGVNYILERSPISGSFTQIANTTSTSFTDSGLPEYTEFNYRLKSRNAESIDSSTIQVSTFTAIVQPGRIDTLTALSKAVETEMELQWSAAGDDGATGNIVGGLFDIRWSSTAITSDADFNAIPQTAQYQLLVATNTAVGVKQGIVLTNLQFNTTIHFAIKTRDEIGNNYSVISNTASERLRVSAPTVFTYSTSTVQSVTWKWTDNSIIENGFRIYSSTGGVVGSTTASTGSGSTVQWTENNLNAGVSYQRTVVAFNEAGESMVSNSTSAYTLSNPPAGLVHSTSTSSGITLVWNSNGNPNGTRYILERATYPASVFAEIADVTAANFADTGLVESATYTYRLRARNGAGVDTTSIQIDTFTVTVKPGRITTLSAQQTQVQGTMLLQWTASGDDGISGNITGGLYDIRWSTNNITSEASFDLIPQTTQYQILVATTAVVGTSQGYLVSGLGNFIDQTLYFAVRTRDEVAGNFSEISNVVSAIPSDFTAPASITNLSAVTLSSTSAKLTWTAPGDDGYSNTNTYGVYDIRYSSNPLSSLALFNQAQSVSSFGTIPLTTSTPNKAEDMILKGLSLDTTYHFAIRVRDEVPNYSALSNGATIHTIDLVAPDPVQNLVAKTNTATGKRIDVSWINPTTPDLKGIRVLASTVGFASLPTETTGMARMDFTSIHPLVPPPTTFAHTDLLIGVTYYYTVFAFDDEPTPNYSSAQFISTVPVKTVLIVAPARPKNLRGTRSQDGQSFRLLWDPVTSKANGEALEPLELSSYTIYRMPSINGTTNQAFTISSSSTTYDDNTLYKQLFYYKVRARNAGGLESEDSDIAVSDGDVIVMMDDGISYIKVDGNTMDSVYKKNVELQGRRSGNDEGGKTFKSMNVDVMDKISSATIKGFVFDTPIQVAIGYAVDGTGNVSNGAPAMNFAQALPSAADAQKAFSIYWFNGVQWLKLGTTIDPDGKTASIRTRHAGKYQLRLVQQALNVQTNSVYPRTITPNGDGVNDMVFFFYENPTDAPTKGTIYDLRSAKVSDVKKTDIFAGNNTVMMWDGKDESGAVVTGGIYMYKIEVGDNTFTGTVVVAR